MSDILEELSAKRREDAKEREATVTFEEILSRAASAPAVRDFAAAFAGDGLRVIAELKRASPSEGMIREDFRPLELAHELEGAGAAALSVLCEPHRFLGDERFLAEVRREVALPVLYKDFVTTRYQIAAARAAGADAVLLIAAVLGAKELREMLSFAHGLGLAALVETHDEREIECAVDAGARIIGVNCRNLRNFTCDTSLIEMLIGRIPRSCIRIAESGMHTGEDLRRAKAAGANGFLVGTALMRSPHPGEKLAEFLNPQSRPASPSR